MVTVALTIAGSDSGGGAGLQADLRVFAAHGLHGACAVAAVTAQNSVRVAAWVALEPAMVAAQIEAVADDMTVAAVKTGVLGSAAIVRAVAEVISRRKLPHLVVDPVMVAKSGDRLLDAHAGEAYREALFPLATLVTPNLAEAAVLTGLPVTNLAEMKAAARVLHRVGAGAVLVKGGHLEGDPVDLLYAGGEMIELPGVRLATNNTHGTGCTLAAAIAARLALGEPLEGAVRGAKGYLTEALRHGYAVGRGHGVPDHLHGLRELK